MSASLTVYSMAAEAEQPHRLRRLEHARRVAEAEAESCAPPRAGILHAAGRWLGAGIARSWQRPIGARSPAAARAAAVGREAG